jgi:hypothetical protein
VEHNILEVIESAINYIPRMKKTLLKTIDYMQSDRENLGMEILKELPEGMGWLLDLSTTFSFMDDKLKFNIDKENIDEALNNILEGINNLDYIMIVDSIEYELIPQIEIYESELMRIYGEVKSGLLAK